MHAALKPAASNSSNRVGSSMSVKVKLLGEFTIQVGVESYLAVLPKLVMRRMTSSAYSVELAG